MKLSLIPIAASILFLSGCPGGDDNEPVTKSYTITVTNLTNNQPLSPITAIAHSHNYDLFSIGKPASLSLEKVAESGDNADYVASIDTDDDVIDVAAGAGVIPPGTSDSVTLTLTGDDETFLSVVSMLVNTNDAFTGDKNHQIDNLGVDQSLTHLLYVWDSGTEANTETADTIPGPAGGGEGFNAVRDEIADQVTFHSGVVTMDDGLATSALNATHRFSNPAAQLVITRTE